MKEFIRTSLWFVLLLAGLSVSLTGCCPFSKSKLTPKNAPDTFPCATEGKLEKTVAPEAELEEFSCSFKKWEGTETLHFKVTIKNISQRPQRFKVNIFLDNGKAVGGLIPRKTKKGLIQPQKTGSFVYPVKGMARQPKGVVLKITTLNP